MTNIEVMYLADRLAAWYDTYSPYEPAEDPQYFYTQLAYKGNRAKLLKILQETRDEMSLDNDADKEAFTRLLPLIDEIEKI